MPAALNATATDVDLATFQSKYEAGCMYALSNMSGLPTQDIIAFATASLAPTGSSTAAAARRLQQAASAASGVDGHYLMLTESPAVVQERVAGFMAGDGAGGRLSLRRLATGLCNSLLPSLWLVRHFSSLTAATGARSPAEKEVSREVVNS